MPRVGKCKKNRASIAADTMEKAAELVGSGQSIRTVAADYGINRNTLKRYMDRKTSGKTCLYGYGAVTEKKKSSLPRSKMI